MRLDIVSGEYILGVFAWSIVPFRSRYSAEVHRIVMVSNRNGGWQSSRNQPLYSALIPTIPGQRRPCLRSKLFGARVKSILLQLTNSTFASGELFSRKVQTSVTGPITPTGQLKLVSMFHRCRAAERAATIWLESFLTGHLRSPVRCLRIRTRQFQPIVS
jgi:hypothetical protein